MGTNIWKRGTAMLCVLTVCIGISMPAHAWADEATNEVFQETVSSTQMEVVDNANPLDVLLSTPGLYVEEESEDVFEEGSGTVGLTIPKRTEQEIRDYVASHPTSINDKVVYDVEPKTSAPYAIGRISDKSLQSSLNFVNTIRYIAGMDFRNGDLVLDGDGRDSAQAEAVVLANAVVFYHDPPKPEGMDDEIYDLSIKDGHAAECLALRPAYANDPKANSMNHEIWSWMSDADWLSTMGHRMSLLYPGIDSIAFGMVRESRSMYNNYIGVMRGYSSSGDKFSSLGGSSSPSEYSYSYPAQEMPIEYFGEDQPWTIWLPQNNMHDVKTTITRKSDGKKWVYSEENESSLKDFYSTGTLTIIYPSGIKYKAGDIYTVHMTGLKSMTGIGDRKLELADNVEFTVHFFSLKGKTASENGDESVEASNKVLAASFDDDVAAVTIGNTSSLPLSYDIDGDVTAIVNWSSSNESVATVSGDGVVTGISTGTAEITATVTTDDDSVGMTATTTVTVVPKIRAYDDVVVEGVTDLPYKKGKAVTQPALVVKNGDIVLTKGTDYTVSYKNNKKVADASSSKAPMVRIKFKGNYSGEIITKFSIIDGDIETPVAPIRTTITSRDITMPANIGYMKSGAKPEPLVVIDGELLANGGDYKVSYSGNKKKGKGTMTITGIGAYMGTVQVPFTIGDGDISKCHISVDGAYYNKTKWKGTVKVYDSDGTTLKSGTDYSLSYNVDKCPAEGSYITVTATGKGNYSGSIVATSYKLQKKAKPISGMTVSFNGSKNRAYQGSPVRLTAQDLTVKYKGTEIAEGSGYRIIMHTANTRKGTAKIWLAGVGEYGGIKAFKYKIKAKPVAVK